MAKQPAKEASASFDDVVADHRADLRTMRKRGMDLLEAFPTASADEAGKALALEAIGRYGTLVLGLTRIIEKERQSFAPVQRPSAASWIAGTGAESESQADESDIERRIADELDRIARQSGADAGGEADCAKS